VCNFLLALIIWYCIGLVLVFVADLHWCPWLTFIRLNAT